MIVVDTSALVAIYREEPEELDFVNLINASPAAAISAATLVELTAVLCGDAVGARRDQVERLVDALALTVKPVDRAAAEIAMSALIAFGKGRHPARLTLGDCFLYALAKSLDAPLLYKGDDFSRTDIAPAYRR